MILNPFPLGARSFFRQKSAFSPPIHLRTPYHGRKPITAHKIVRDPPSPLCQEDEGSVVPKKNSRVLDTISATGTTVAQQAQQGTTRRYKALQGATKALQGATRHYSRGILSQPGSIQSSPLAAAVPTTKLQIT